MAAIVGQPTEAKMNQKPIPNEVQLQAACFVWDEREIKKVLEPYGAGSDFSDLRGTKKTEWAKKNFNFTSAELIAYLSADRERCERVLGYSCDQRWSPAPFLNEIGESYEVGLFDGHEKREIQYFDKFEEAAADFVLFQWGLPRLVGKKFLR